MDKIKRKALQRELKAVEDAYAGTLGWLDLQIKRALDLQIILAGK